MTPEQKFAAMINQTQALVVTMRSVMTLLMADADVTDEAVIALMEQEYDPIVVATHAQAVRQTVREMRATADRIRKSRDRLTGQLQ